MSAPPARRPAGSRLRRTAAPAAAGLVAALAAALALAPAPAGAASPPAPAPGSVETARPPSPTAVPRGYRLTPRKAIAVAEGDAKVQRVRREHPGVRPQATTKGAGRWQVGYYAGGRELAQVSVSDASGRVLESWDGPQVAWLMARGYPGAFGRKVNAPYVWLPLCAAFLLAFFDRRRPLRLAHLDLLALLGFGASHLFFNRAQIGVSVPLAYPVLAYLLARMLWIGFRGQPRGGRLRPALPVAWLALAALFLVGFRLGLNVADSNVIDVGYSGVIGADRIADGRAVYGSFPADDQAGDTYGPVAYYAYLPFEQALPWSGRWDDLPAAHGAAVFFDLATMLGLFLAGRRLRPGGAGHELGVVLAFAWAAYPYTTFALASNANDSLVAALVVYSFLALSSPPLRGALLALASATKFAPLALAPLLATAGRPRIRAPALFAAAFLAVAALAMVQTALDPGLARFWERTLGFQAGRDSPFSIWGQVGGIEWLQTLAKAATLGLALAVAFVPRRKTPYQVAALGAAILIAVQLTVEHWFYLYIVWFFPLLAIALTAPGRERSAS